MRDLMVRFFSYVQKTPSCWNWIGYKLFGYGYITINYKNVRAHRYLYIRTKGPVPEGMVLDHLCRNRACVNPDHLEPVTHAENFRRSPIMQWKLSQTKAYCKSGHAFDTINTGKSKRGGGKTSVRRCLACHRIREANRRKTKKEGNTYV